MLTANLSASVTLNGLSGQNYYLKVVLEAFGWDYTLIFCLDIGLKLSITCLAVL
jgi:hypothetical protein